MACQPTAQPGAAPASVAACDISASPLKVGWPDSLVREDHGEVSPLARGGMSPVGGSPPIRPITGRPWLAPRSWPRCPVGRPCGRLPPPPWSTQQGSQRGYLLHLPDHPGVRSCLSAGGATSAAGER